MNRAMTYWMNSSTSSDSTQLDKMAKKVVDKNLLIVDYMIGVTTNSENNDKVPMSDTVLVKFILDKKFSRILELDSDHAILTIIPKTSKGHNLTYRMSELTTSKLDEEKQVYRSSLDRTSTTSKLLGVPMTKPSSSKGSSVAVMKIGSVMEMMLSNESNGVPRPSNVYQAFKILEHTNVSKSLYSIETNFKSVPIAKSDYKGEYNSDLIRMLLESDDHPDLVKVNPRTKLEEIALDKVQKLYLETVPITSDPSYDYDDSVAHTGRIMESRVPQLGSLHRTRKKLSKSLETALLDQDLEVVPTSEQSYVTALATKIDEMMSKINELLSIYSEYSYEYTDDSDVGDEIELADLTDVTVLEISLISPSDDSIALIKLVPRDTEEEELEVEYLIKSSGTNYLQYSRLYDMIKELGKIIRLDQEIVGDLFNDELYDIDIDSISEYTPDDDYKYEYDDEPNYEDELDVPDLTPVDDPDEDFLPSEEDDEELTQLDKQMLERIRRRSEEGT